MKDRERRLDRGRKTIHQTVQAAGTEGAKNRCVNIRDACYLRQERAWLEGMSKGMHPAATACQALY